MPTSATTSGGGSVALDGSASDADDSALTYRWTSDGGGTFRNASAPDTTWSAPAATSTEQSITLTLTSTDATMASDTATVQVTVRANQPPEDVRVAPESAIVGGTTRLTLNGTATDPEGGRLTYAWTSSGGGVFANASALDTTWRAGARQHRADPEGDGLTYAWRSSGGGTFTDASALATPWEAPRRPMPSRTSSSPSR